jgi:hypothetical protein
VSVEVETFMMRRRSFLWRAAASVSAAVFPSGSAAANLSAAGLPRGAGQTPSDSESLPFRAMLASYGHPRDQDKGNFWNKEYWDRILTQWSKESFHVVIWLGTSEVSTGDHVLIRFRIFPEARELSPEENEKTIVQVKWLLRRAK